MNQSQMDYLQECFKKAAQRAKKAGFEAVESCLSATWAVSLETTEKSAKAIIKAADDAGVSTCCVPVCAGASRRRRARTTLE